MAKVTSKLQITIPKALAEQMEIRQGDEVEWSTAGDSLRLKRGGSIVTPEQRVEERLRQFDQATQRLRRRRSKIPAARTRGWTREELYDRGAR